MECAYRKIAGYTTVKIGIKKKLGMCSLENCQLHNPIKVGINKTWSVFIGKLPVTQIHKMHINELRA